MRTSCSLELLAVEEQIVELRLALHPSRSRLRPYLALFAMKSFLERDAGTKRGAAPTVRWYQGRLTRAGLSADNRAVRRQLDNMARVGVVDKVRGCGDTRGAAGGSKTSVRVGVNEYHLNEAIFPALEQTLKLLLGVGTMYGAR